MEKWPELRLAVRLSVVGAASHGVAVLASISAVAARFAEAACASLLGSRGGNWEILTASAFVAIVVPILVFFALQRYLVRGLLAGSVKGG